MSGRVAFVAIGRNEGERLRLCLGALLRQTDRVIYVDSASSDGSAELARSLGVPTVQLHSNQLLSAARGRNAGFEQVRERFPNCEFVHFIDGDCIIADGWVEQAVAFMDSSPRAAIACGRRFEAHPRASLYNHLIDEEWNTPVGRADASGGDALVRVAAFEQVGGFNSELRAGEEPEMAARMRAAGWEIWRLDAPMTEHDARILRFGQWWTRCVRGGFGFAQVWSMTRSVFGRQLRSAFLWTLGIPLGFCVAALLLREPLVLLGIPLAFAAQVARIAARRGFSNEAWQSAAMLMLAKLPETIGALGFFLGRKPQQLAEYKAPE
jgi:glycosyltransferase involved in cell wall biosynthesis